VELISGSLGMLVVCAIYLRILAGSVPLLRRAKVLLISLYLRVLRMRE
jgi:hypothetical protein